MNTLSRTTRPRTAQSGFTLVEVLIALAITGLLVSILISALFFLHRVQQSLEEESMRREQSLRGEAWFRESLRGCLARPAESTGRFTGNTTSLSCESLSPVIPDSASVPTQIELQLRSTATSVVLEYIEPGRLAATPIARWDTASASFSYQDLSSKEHDAWPPTNDHPELLPRLVTLKITPAQSPPTSWLAALPATPFAPLTAASPPGIITR